MATALKNVVLASSGTAFGERTVPIRLITTAGVLTVAQLLLSGVSSALPDAAYSAVAMATAAKTAVIASTGAAWGIAAKTYYATIPLTIIPPPFDPSSSPWYTAANSGDPPDWRIGTLASRTRGPELPQPTLDPLTIPFYPVVISGEPPIWRRRTLDSRVRGPELPQPPLNPLTVPFELASDFAQRVTPLWRYATLPSRAIPFFPSLATPKQINLVNQGINHRGMGALRVTGGNQGLLAFVQNANSSSTFLAYSARITRQLGTSGTAELKFLVSAPASIPALGSSITIIEASKIKFAGLIDRRRYTVLAATSQIEVTAYCVDWNGILQRHLIAATVAAGTLSSITDSMLRAPSINADRISAAGVDTSLSTGDEFDWAYIKISDAFTQLALSTNTIWWVDNYKVLHMILVANAIASAYSVAENAQQVDPLVVVEDSLANYRNTQYVRTSNAILSESVTVTDTHTFDGTLGDQGLNTRYSFTSSPQSVKENNVELVGTDRFFQLKAPVGATTYPASGDGYYWVSGGGGIFHWPTNVTVTAGTILTATYTGVSTFAGNVVVYKDAAQITAMQAVTGGSGIFEEIEDFSGSVTYTQALALAQGMEQSTAPVPQTVTVSTTEVIEDIGYNVSVVLPRWGLNGSYIIQQMTLIDMGADQGKGTRFRTTLQLVAARTLGNFTQYFERLLQRLNKGLVQTPQQMPTWELASDHPGAPSNGLVVGSFGAPAAMLFGQGRITYVSATFITAADQDIVIDIFLNGLSIFTSAKLRYTPSMTGTEQRYGNLNLVNINRGDLLTLSVLQCGTIDPGKNGTVVVVIGAR